VYLDVLFSEEYRSYVSEILIEGHTDSLGTYLDNLALSQQRALAVASYVLDDDYRGISADQKRQLRAVVTANGRSFSDPVLDANGFEDMDASRRVVFKFRLTDEQMIQQLKSILEANET
jgi:chemotaxis protein MotB